MSDAGSFASHRGARCVRIADWPLTAQTWAKDRRREGCLARRSRSARERTDLARPWSSSARPSPTTCGGSLLGTLLPGSQRACDERHMYDPRRNPSPCGAVCGDLRPLPRTRCRPAETRRRRPANWSASSSSNPPIRRGGRRPPLLGDRIHAARGKAAGRLVRDDAEQKPEKLERVAVRWHGRLETASRWGCAGSRKSGAEVRHVTPRPVVPVSLIRSRRLDCLPRPVLCR